VSSAKSEEGSIKTSYLRLRGKRFVGRKDFLKLNNYEEAVFY
jgi:hypothetical protein